MPNPSVRKSRVPHQIRIFLILNHAHTNRNKHNWFNIPLNLFSAWLLQHHISTASSQNTFAVPLDWLENQNLLLQVDVGAGFSLFL